MYTIGDLCKQFKLSRSTLLYYDRIGLLRSSGRTQAEYRLYSQKDVDRMSKIALYKQAGLPLSDIKDLLESSETQLSKLLEQRLGKLNEEMSRIRQQQHIILDLLGNDSLLKSARVMNKDQWVSILRDSGLDEEDMMKWHMEFERNLPEAHSDFLESLGMSKKEIKAVKTASRKGIAL